MRSSNVRSVPLPLLRMLTYSHTHLRGHPKPMGLYSCHCPCSNRKVRPAALSSPANGNGDETEIAFLAET